MKGFGVYIDEYYSSTSPLSQAAPSFNYQQWSQDKKVLFYLGLQRRFWSKV